MTEVVIKIVITVKKGLLGKQHGKGKNFDLNKKLENSQRKRIKFFFIEGYKHYTERKLESNELNVKVKTMGYIAPTIDYFPKNG